MSAYVETQLKLLRPAYPDLEYHEEGHWARLPGYPAGAGWSAAAVDVVFRIPPEAATAPYGFYVSPPLFLAGGGMPSNFTHPVEAGTVPFAGDWALFSWSPTAWRPQGDVGAGDNMLHFARSIADRFAEAS